MNIQFVTFHNPEDDVAIYRRLTITAVLLLVSNKTGLLYHTRSIIPFYLGSNAACTIPIVKVKPTIKHAEIAKPP